MKLTKKQRRALNNAQRFHYAKFIIEGDKNIYSQREIQKKYLNEEIQDIALVKPILRPFLDMAKTVTITERDREVEFNFAKNFAKEVFLQYDKNQFKDAEYEITGIKTKYDYSQDFREVQLQRARMQAYNSDLYPKDTNSTLSNLDDELEKNYSLLLKEQKQFEEIYIKVVDNKYQKLTIQCFGAENYINLLGYPFRQHLSLIRAVQWYDWFLRLNYAVNGIMDDEYITFAKAKELGYNIEDKIGG